MNPETNEGRIGRLERDMAGVQQRVDDLRSDVKELAPLPLAVAKMEGALERMQTDLQTFDSRLERGLHALEKDIGKVTEMIATSERERAEREEADAQRRAEERRDARRSRAALVVGCTAAILAPLGAILAAIIQGG